MLNITSDEKEERDKGVEYLANDGVLGNKYMQIKNENLRGGSPVGALFFVDGRGILSFPLLLHRAEMRGKDLVRRI